MTKHGNNKYEDEEEALYPSSYNLIRPLTQAPEIKTPVTTTEYCARAVHVSDVNTSLSPQVELKYQTSCRNIISMPTVELYSPKLVATSKTTGPTTMTKVPPSIPRRSNWGFGYTTLPTESEPAAPSSPPQIQGGNRGYRIGEDMEREM